MKGNDGGGWTAFIIIPHHTSLQRRLFSFALYRSRQKSNIWLLLVTEEAGGRFNHSKAA